MIIEAETIPGGTELTAAVVVIGAGPGGIALALELGRRAHEVLVIESGGLRADPAIQALSEPARFDARRHAPMNEATRRQLGGASVIWGGRCVPYDRVDFDARPFVPEARWPLGYDEIAGYFQRTSDYFFTGRAIFDAFELPEVREKTLVPGLPDGDVRTSELERWSLPTDFGRHHRQELDRSRAVRVIVGLTVTEIVSSEDGRVVSHVVAKTIDGRRFEVRGAAFVVAAGGVESTRLLMASDRHHPGGIGNHAGQLGRWYMGHISGRIARVRFTTPARATRYGFERDREGVYLRRRLTLSREAQWRERVTNVVGWLANPTIGDPAHGNGILSFAYLALTAPVVSRYFAPEAIRKSATQGAPAGAGWKHVANMLGDLPRTLTFIPTFGWKRFVARRRVPGFFQPSADNRYDLHYHGEQVPNRDSRILLSDARDLLGMRRVELDLRYCQTDFDAVVKVHRLWDGWLRRHGVGELEWLSEELEASVAAQARDGFHQIGTARMAEAPADGVVDRECRVFGVDNLYVASSAVFPSSGQANSTFMIVAFALRLADRLSGRR